MIERTASSQPSKTQEIRRRRKNVERRAAHAALAPPVLTKVAQHVNQRVANCSWRFEITAVESSRGESPALRQQPIHVIGEATGQGFHAARELGRVLCFDEQVNVIALHAELADAEMILHSAVRRSDRNAHRGKHVLRAQGATRRAQSDVNRKSSLMDVASAMRHGRAQHPAWASGACSHPTAPDDTSRGA